MRYLSMFRGIGGFDCALNKLGHTCIGYSEIDPGAIKIYRKNFGVEVTNYGNATTINTGQLPDFDLLCGGFPCQTFSIAGKRRGFEDSRGTLFFELARIARDKRPSILFFENVKGLLSHDRGRTFAIILSILDELGYDAQWQVCNSRYFGVPQNRERIFIIGHLRGKSRPKVFPLCSEDTSYSQKLSATTLDAGYGKGIDNHGARTGIIQLVPDAREDKRIYHTDGISCTLMAQGGDRVPMITNKIITHSLFPRSSTTKKGGTGPLYREDNIAYCLDTGNAQAIQVIAKPVMTPVRLEKRQLGRRIKEDGDPMFTLTAQDRHGISDDQKIRRLTPLECERLQGFPEGWTTQGIDDKGKTVTMSDSARYKCLGNAVTVNVIYAIAKRLLN